MLHLPSLSSFYFEPTVRLANFSSPFCLCGLYQFGQSLNKFIWFDVNSDFYCLDFFIISSQKSYFHWKYFFSFLQKHFFLIILLSFFIPTYFWSGWVCNIHIWHLPLQNRHIIRIFIFKVFHSLVGGTLRQYCIWIFTSIKAFVFQSMIRITISMKFLLFSFIYFIDWQIRYQSIKIVMAHFCNLYWFLE